MFCLAKEKKRNKNCLLKDEDSLNTENSVTYGWRSIK